jgi:hypothetical protein
MLQKHTTLDSLVGASHGVDMHLWRHVERPEAQHPVIAATDQEGAFGGTAVDVRVAVALHGSI